MAMLQCFNVSNKSIKRLEVPVQIEELSNELLDSCDQFRDERIENSCSGEACPIHVALACPGRCGPNKWALDLQSNSANHICKALCCRACLGIFDRLSSSLQLIFMRLLQGLHVPERTLGL